MPICWINHGRMQHGLRVAELWWWRTGDQLYVPMQKPSVGHIFQQVMSTNSCSQVPPPFCSDGNTCLFKHSCCFFKCFFLKNEPGIGSVWVVTLFWANINDAIPPCLEPSKASTCCSIIRKPDMLGFFILKTVHEWSDCDGIHCHGEWITLGCSFLGEERFLCQ